MTIGAGVCDLVSEHDINTLNLAFSLSVIKFAIDSGILAGDISIFLEETLDTSDSLIDAAARGNVCLHLLVIILYWSHLSYHYLSFGSK